jgi:phage-related protein
MPTFTPPSDPQISANEDHSYRVLNAQFGDGYEQIAGDGLNTKLYNITLNWNALSKTNADSIETFLDARTGSEAFDYTVPGGTLKKYRCDTWTRTRGGPYDSINASFREVYDL